MQYSEKTEITNIDDIGRPTMNWGAVFGGWLIATGMGSLMWVAGLALGFSGFDAYNIDATAKGLGAGTAVWVLLTLVVALFLGGMFASWFDGRSDQTVGALHGITVWGLSMVGSALLVALGLAHVVHGGAAIIGGGLSSAGAPAMGPGGPIGFRSGPSYDALVGLQAQLRQGGVKPSTGQSSANPANTSGTPPNSIQPAQPDASMGAPAGRMDREVMAEVATALLRGKPENARAVLLANTSMTPSEVDQTLQSLTPQVEKYKAQVQAAADSAAHYTAMAMWTIFLGMLIAMVAAAIGGWLGAGHIHRVHHLRRYETTRSKAL